MSALDGAHERGGALVTLAGCHILIDVIALETSFLAPSASFLILVALYEVLLVIIPAIDAARQRRWVWFVAILILQPVAGLLWYAFRWTGTRCRQTA